MEDSLTELAGYFRDQIPLPDQALLRLVSAARTGVVCRVVPAATPLLSRLRRAGQFRMSPVCAKQPVQT